MSGSPARRRRGPGRLPLSGVARQDASTGVQGNPPVSSGAGATWVRFEPYWKWLGAMATVCGALGTAGTIAHAYLMDQIRVSECVLNARIEAAWSEIKLLRLARDEKLIVADPVAKVAGAPANALPAVVSAERQAEMNRLIQRRMHANERNDNTCRHAVSNGTYVRLTMH